MGDMEFQGSIVSPGLEETPQACGRISEGDMKRPEMLLVLKIQWGRGGGSSKGKTLATKWLCSESGKIVPTERVLTLSPGGKSYLPHET